MVKGTRLLNGPYTNADATRKTWIDRSLISLGASPQAGSAVHSPSFSQHVGTHAPGGPLTCLRNRPRPPPPQTPAEKNIVALKNVLERVPGARLALVGDGPQREELERMFAGMPVKFMVRGRREQPHLRLRSARRRGSWRGSTLGGGLPC